MFRTVLAALAFSLSLTAAEHLNLASKWTIGVIPSDHPWAARKIQLAFRVVF